MGDILDLVGSGLSDGKVIGRVTNLVLECGGGSLGVVSRG